MWRFRCPECGTITDVVPRDEDEVVSVYCLRHKGGPDFHLRPVYMTPVPMETTARSPEPLAA